MLSQNRRIFIANRCHSKSVSGLWYYDSHLRNHMLSLIIDLVQCPDFFIGGM